MHSELSILKQTLQIHDAEVFFMQMISRLIFMDVINRSRGVRTANLKTLLAPAHAK